MKKKRGRKRLKNIKDRKCIYCKRILPISMFHKSKYLSGGMTYTCGECGAKIAHKRCIKLRLKKYGLEKILQEIKELEKGIILRKKILKEEESCQRKKD